MLINAVSRLEYQIHNLNELKDIVSLEESTVTGFISMGYEP